MSRPPVNLGDLYRIQRVKAEEIVYDATQVA